MALVVPNSAEGFILGYIVGTDTPEALTIRLFGNDYTPTEIDTVAAYTEVTGGGYAGISLSSLNWTITDGDPSLAEHTQVSWTFDATAASVGNVYGYYVTRDTSSDLVWAERFTNGPYNIQTENDQIRITPRLTAN
jgi:hypothetical protein